VGTTNNTVASVGIGTATINGTGTITSSGNFSATSNASGTVNAKLAGAGKVVKTGGNGTLILTNSGNNFTGGAVTSGGATTGHLIFSSGALGTTGNVTFMGTATNFGGLDWSGINTDDISSRLVINSGAFANINIGTNNVTFASGFG